MPFSTWAQDDVEYRMEVGVSAGMGSMLSDVNSKLFGNAQAAGGGMVRFIINPRMAIKTSLTYMKVEGSTDKVKGFYPADPGQSGTERLSFQANGGVTDLNALYELHFLPYGYEGGYQGFKRLVP